MATDCVARQVARWLRSIGVEAHYETEGRKHDRVTLTYNGETRFIVCSRSPKDTDGTINHTKKTAKGILRGLGFKI